MHVTCPNCSTKYNLPDEMFRPGAKARCTVCKHMFPLAGQEPERPSRSLNDIDDSSIDDLLGEGGDELSFDSGKKKKGSKGKKGKMALILVLLVVVLGGGGAAAWFLLPQFMGDKGTDTPSAAGNASEETAATENIKNLALRNVRQYYQDNEKIGQLFVVEGKVVNNFTVPKELVKVEVTLFDGNNVTITSKQQYCGVSVSLFQLQVLGQQELESALNNKIEILTNNTNIAPGQEVPFMVVFYNPSENVAEFGVKVIEAKDPPKK